MGSTTRWEIDQADWDLVKAAVRRQMVVSARNRTTLSYTELVDDVGHLSGPDSHALAEMLGEINAEEDFYGDRPLLLSAVVTHKNDAYPGVGFLRPPNT